MLALLPLHALLKMIVAKIFATNPDFLPMHAHYFAAWKEVLIFILGILFLFQWIRNRKCPCKLQVTDFLFLFWLLTALIGFFLTSNDYNTLIWGLKYDFSFLLLYIFLRPLKLQTAEKNKMIKIFLMSLYFVLAYGLLAYFVLPDSVLHYLGYSNNLSTFSIDKPLSAYQTVSGGIARMASSLSGPNQLGSYLLVVLSFFLAFRKKYLRFYKDKQYFILIALIISCILLTFSKAAFLGMCLILTIYFTRYKRMFTPKKIAVYSLVFLVIGVSLVSTVPKLRNLIIRPASFERHIASKIRGVETFISNLHGTGIGTVGPAARGEEKFYHVYLSKTEVDEFSKDISISDRNHIWFYEKEEMLRFKPLNIDELRAMPTYQHFDSDKKHILENLYYKNYVERMPENWHLQVFIQYGIWGAIFYVLFWYFFIKKYYLLFTRESAFTFMALSALLLSGMFLHSFEDSTSVYTLFILIALL